MIKGVRVPERVYGVVLWVVSVVFAGFLIGFGNLIIGDLPQVERSIAREQFADAAASQKIRAEIRSISERRAVIDDRLEVARLQLEQARSASQTGAETFEAWIKTRTATTNPQQDPEVLSRTRQLEQLKGNERAAQTAVDALDSERVPLDQRESDLNAQQGQLGREPIN